MSLSEQHSSHVIVMKHPVYIFVFCTILLSWFVTLKDRRTPSVVTCHGKNKSVKWDSQGCVSFVNCLQSQGNPVISPAGLTLYSPPAVPTYWWSNHWSLEQWPVNIHSRVGRGIYTYSDVTIYFFSSIIYLTSDEVLHTTHKHNVQFFPKQNSNFTYC